MKGPFANWKKLATSLVILLLVVAGIWYYFVATFELRLVNEPGLRGHW